MVRWDPDARGRLERAALELFTEQGFAATTVPQITERAGLTTRTFFRHFPDKREVLFAGADELRSAFVAILESAPDGASASELLEHGLERAATELFGPRFDDVRRWRAIVGTDEALRERTLRKQQRMAESASAALVGRGMDPETADRIAALAGILIERSVARWVEQPTERRPLLSYVRDELVGARTALAATSKR